jgi:hypothetical protein
MQAAGKFVVVPDSQTLQTQDRFRVPPANGAGTPGMTKILIADFGCHRQAARTPPE